ncbi:hypothetical protein TB1_030947 [Malus domestica]
MDLLKIVKKVSGRLRSGRAFDLGHSICLRTARVRPGRLRSGDSVPQLRLPLPGLVPSEMQPGSVRREGHCQVWIAIPVQTGSRVEAGARM